MNHLDRKDRYLLVKGCMSVFLGYAYAVAHVPQGARNSLSTVTGTFPLSLYGALWICTGVYCIIASLSARRINGWTVGVFTPAVWGALYLVCWFHGDPGRGWVFTGIFWSIAGAMYYASGLVDPGPTLRRNDQL